MDWGGVISQVESLLDSQGTLRSSFLWRGTPRYGVRATLRREDVNTNEGLAGVYVFSLLCAASQFSGESDTPKPRVDKITVDGKTMRVLSVERDSVGATVRLHLGDEMA